MKLSDTRIKNTKPTGAQQKLADGGGLTLVVKPSGGKVWWLRYRYAGKEKTIVLGAYPQVSLAEARAERDRMKRVLAAGQDPVTARRVERLTQVQAAADTFEGIAKEFAAKQAAAGKKEGSRQYLRLLELHAFPTMGALPVNAVTPRIVLEVVLSVEAKGITVTALRVRHAIGQVMRYAVATARCEYDPTSSIRGAVMTPQVEHHAAADDPQALWRMISAYKSLGGTTQALQLLMLTAVRSTEIRHMELSELNLDEQLWVIPGEKMKKKRPHVVPLSTQAMTVLEDWLAVAKPTRYVFENQRTPGQVMSTATMCRAMTVMKAPITPHGFRSTFSTHSYRRQKPGHLIELQLAHAEDNKVKAAYNHYLYLEERRELLQEWADWVAGTAGRG